MPPEFLKRINQMNFGEALKHLKFGKKLARTGWNGKGMYLIYVPGSKNIKPTEGSPYAKAGLTELDINPHVDMMTANGSMQPGWLASQTEMLAEDWEIV
jgi:hypothetical protein